MKSQRYILATYNTLSQATVNFIDSSTQGSIFLEKKKNKTLIFKSTPI